MPEDSCPLRLALSRAAADATAESYRANAEYDEAMRKGAGNLKTLAGVLYKAMRAEDGLSPPQFKIRWRGARKQPRFPRRGKRRDRISYYFGSGGGQSLRYCGLRRRR